MNARDLAISTARGYGAPFIEGSLWDDLSKEAAASIAALPAHATSEDCAVAVLAYLARPRTWEPPHNLRRNLCEGLARRIRTMGL
jgi:hypothetical protein